MSFDIDRLDRRISSLEFSKVEHYKFDDLEIKVYNLKEQIINLQNRNSYFEERISKLEQINLEKENEISN